MLGRLTGMKNTKKHVNSLDSKFCSRQSDVFARRILLATFCAACRMSHTQDGFCGHFALVSLAQNSKLFFNTKHLDGHCKRPSDDRLLYRDFYCARLAARASHNWRKCFKFVNS